MGEYTYDVFVSYSKADRDWVREQLLPRLEGAGLKVLLDSRDFEIGAPKVVNIERAVKCSRHTLIVLTPGWIEGEWSEFESLLIGTIDPAARQRKLIPLMLDPCELPERIAMLTYADLTAPGDRAWQWERLIATLSGLRPAESRADGAPPQDTRPHVCGETHPHAGDGAPPQDARSQDGNGAPPQGGAPCAPTGQPEFVNRERELDLLDVERLRASRSPYTLISAPAGYGKTYLLRKVLHLVEEDEALRSRWSSRTIEFAPPESGGPASGGPGTGGTATGSQGGTLPASIAREIAREIVGETVSGDPDTLIDRVCEHIVHQLAAALPDGRRAVLLVLDGVERLAEETRQWLYALLCQVYRRTRIGPQEAVIVRVILAGHNVDRFWEGYERACPTPPAPQRIDLSPFDEYAIQELVWSQARAAHIVLDDHTVRWIANHVRYLSGGHPKVIHGLVGDLARRLFMIGPVAEYYARHQERLLRAYLSGVADELLQGLDAGLRDVVQRLSVFRRVNANTVQALVAEKVFPPETDEVELLGDLQRAHVLQGPRIGDPFYRDPLVRRVLALDLAYRSVESRALFQRLNRLALDLYAGWVRDGGKLPDSHVKATQRLFAVVEWLYHALHEREMGVDALRAGLRGHLAALGVDKGGDSAVNLIADEIQRDAQVRYLLRGRLGEDGVKVVCGWLQEFRRNGGA